MGWKGCIEVVRQLVIVGEERRGGNLSLCVIGVYYQSLFIEGVVSRMY